MEDTNSLKATGGSTRPQPVQPPIISMKSRLPAVLAALAVLGLGPGSVTAQTVIFNENFDGGYTGAFGLSHYSGGSPDNTTNLVLASGGNPNGCWQETMTPTTTGDYYAGQVQLMTVAGNTDPDPGNYVLSFDARGSQAATIGLSIQTWPGNYFSGTGPVINASVNEQLATAGAWQTFSVNLGTITTAGAGGATWQLNFSISASQWGGVGPTDVLAIDNLVLTHLNKGLWVSSSANPSAYNAAVTFTAAVVTNGVTAGNATGMVVFSSAAGPFSTNTVAGGSATSAALTNLPVGANTVAAVYSGGNYSAATNTLTQMVNAPTSPGVAQSGLSLYTDNLVNGFQNWSWATVNLLGIAPVHSGNYAIAVTDGGNQALAFNRAQFNSSPYANLTFWVNGGSNGGQLLQVWGLLDYNAQKAVPVAALPANNTWQQVTVPLSTLGVANKSNLTGFWIQGRSGGQQPAFYVDDVQLTPAATPAVVHLGADAGQTLRPVDARQFGLNTATWDGSLGDSQTLPLLQQIGIRALRWPGGSSSDLYHWASDLAGNATFQTLATNLGAQVFTTINYGSGTPAEAAAWVRMANQTNHCGFQYWEIGNECYGSWENDTHAVQHDPYTYATNAVACIQQMKAAYPAVPIKIGVVVVPGEASYSNNATHFAINPRTGTTNYGWTPIVLSVMNSLGVTPDFLIYHFYPQYTSSGWTYYSGSPDSDPLLLQVAGNPSPSNWSDWASAATDLRQQITDYVGGGIELCVTENNSDAGAMGRQSTSLVNALYLADSTSALMKTEFRSYLWWDLHNGYETDGNFDPTIYGWRPNGDYGILSGANSPYPTFYAEKLLQNFARPGDAVLATSSDNLLLSAYAVRRTNGALTLLVINKDMTTNLTAQVALTNFAKWSTASLLSYGIPQDQAAQTNGAAALQDLAGASYPSAAAGFSYTFAPLSLTLFTFAPGPATVAVQAVLPGQVQLLLQGQPGTPYIIQSSPDLFNWSSVATNNLTDSSASVPVRVPPGAPAQFFRAVWQP
jgi:alpha-N-arabinofuranosidase